MNIAAPDAATRLARLVDEVSLPAGFRVVIGRDPVTDGGKPFLQVAALRRDVVTGEMGEGKGGKAYPSQHACDSEIVGALFGLYKSYLEHEARETFRFRRRRIYGPHIDVRALHDAAADAGARPHSPCVDVTALLAEVSLADGHRLVLRADGRTSLLHVAGTHGDSPATHLPDGASDTQVLDAAFSAYRRFVEDGARSTFLLRGRAIYSARVDAHALWAASTRIDVRRATA